MKCEIRPRLGFRVYAKSAPVWDLGFMRNPPPFFEGGFDFIFNSLFLSPQDCGNRCFRLTRDFLGILHCSLDADFFHKHVVLSSMP